MSACKLHYVFRSFVKETSWILEHFHICLPRLAVDDSARLAGEMAIVRLHDAWARYNRNLVILSAVARPMTAGGMKLPYAPGVKSYADVMVVLASKEKRFQRFEPKWAIAKDTIDAAKALHLTNYVTISGAIGAMSSPADEIRVVRNFFAHRGMNTATQIRSKTFHRRGMSINVEELAGEVVATGITRMEKWVIELRILAEAAIQ